MKLEDKLDNIGALHHIVTCTPVVTDIITSLCGKHISEGSFRSVYEYSLDNNYVVKLENNNSNCNTVEYMIWQEVQCLCNELEWVKNWFAPVKWISPNGRVLLMKKTKDAEKPPKGLKIPEKIPSFLWDIKLENFGWIGKNFVCHDYGQFYNMIHYPKKMKKINWQNNNY